MTTQLEAPTTTVTKVGGSLGAIVGGVRLGGDLSAETVAEIRQALLTHKVIFFRGQEHLDDAGQLAFAQLLGTPTLAAPDLEEHRRQRHVLPIDSDYGKANSWHTDVTFVDRIPAISLLRRSTLPAYGGSDQLGEHRDGVRAAARPLKALVERLWAVHSNLYDYAGRATRRGSAAST